MRTNGEVVFAKNCIIFSDIIFIAEDSLNDKSGTQ
jgi:hypothetical protein